MLKDQDRIFKNLYNDMGADVAAAQTRGDWVNTSDLTSKGRAVSYTHLTLPTTPDV